MGLQCYYTMTWSQDESHLKVCWSHLPFLRILPGAYYRGKQSCKIRSRILFLGAVTRRSGCVIALFYATPGIRSPHGSTRLAFKRNLANSTKTFVSTQNQLKTARCWPISLNFEHDSLTWYRKTCMQVPAQRKHDNNFEYLPTLSICNCTSRQNFDYRPQGGDVVQC